MAGRMDGRELKMRNLKLNSFSFLRGAKRSKHGGNLLNLATLNTALSKRHPDPDNSGEGSAKLCNCADSLPPQAGSLSLRMTLIHIEFLIL